MSIPSTPSSPQPHQLPDVSSDATTVATTCDTPGSSEPVDSESMVLFQHVQDIALLLHQASLAAWEIGDRAHLSSEMHHLGLGAYLAYGNAVALLPTDHLVSQCWPMDRPPAENDPTRLVASAETRLRALLPDAAPGLSDLLLEVCDLVRECRQHAELDLLDPAQRSETHRHGM